MYKTTLQNLSADLHQASSVLGTLEMGEVDAPRLHTILEQFRNIDPLQNNEASPKITISSVRGRFHVSTVSGKLYLTEAYHSSGEPRELSIEGILGELEGIPSDEDTEEQTPVSVPNLRPPAMNRVLSSCMLVAGLGLNGYTLYAAFYVDDINIAPPLTLITERTEYVRKIEAIAGSFATGAEKGDRGLVVNIDGTVLLQELANQGKVKSEKQAGYSLGQRDKKLFLAIKPKGQIEVVNRDTLLLYGDTYRRTN